MEWARFFFFVVRALTFAEKVQYSGPVKTIAPFSVDFEICGKSPFSDKHN